MTHPYDGQASHQQVWELLAWYVNDTATPDQRQIVERHLPHCEACRAEHDAQRLLHAHLRTDGAVPDPAPGLARLLGDIERSSAPQPKQQDEQSATATPHLLHSMSRRLKFAVAALAALAVLESATLAMLGFGRADYQTLSAPPPSAAAHATIRLVPAPTMTVGELQAHLRRFGLQVVGGPTEAGVYSLAPVAADTDHAAALAGLRATQGVLFAEPIGAER